MSAPRIVSVEPLLQKHYREFDFKRHVPRDPVKFPHQYAEREDIEVIAFIASALAFGRVSAFEPHLERICGALGAEPAHTLRAATGPSPDPEAYERVRVAGAWKYRWLNPEDLVAMLLAVGEALHRWGTLEASFAAFLPKGELTSVQEEIGLWGPLGDWLAALRELALAAHPTPTERHRAMAFLFPSARGTAACKRQHMFLRWMVRPDDEGVDFGIWTVITPAQLVAPCDTHTARIGHALGLCASSDPSRRTAEELTRSLRLFDATDPARFDFALAHLGISGGCRAAYLATVCETCSLREACQWWGRL